MTPAERNRLYRERKAAREQAVRVAEASTNEAAARIVAQMHAAPGGPVPMVLPPTRIIPPIVVSAHEAPQAPPPPCPLPDDPAERARALVAEMEAACRAIMLDPGTPAASRVAAMRSLGELHGVLRQRAPASDPARGRDFADLDPADLAAAAEATRADLARLTSLAEALQPGPPDAAATMEGMPWD